MRIKKASIYIDSQKIGTASNNSLSGNNNTERMVGTDGIVGGTDGTPFYDLEFDVIITENWDGAQQKLLDAFDQQKEVELVYLSGSKLKRGPYKFEQFRMTSEPVRGTMMGNFRALNTGPVKTV